MKVKPPVGQGRVRLVRIGSGADTLDLQPCGGTHVRSTGEIGRAADRQDREEGPGEPARQPALRRLSRACEGPMALYRRKVAEGALDADPAQRLAVEKLQLLAMRLADYNPARPKRVGLGRFGWGRDRLEEKPVPGLYLYGGVGRGKSMLMDLFFETAPVSPKRRVHFHAFMQEVHARHRQGARRRRDRPGAPGRRRGGRRGDAALLRRDADHRHHRRDAGRAAVRAAVRARRRRRRPPRTGRRTSSTRTG